MDEDKSKLLKDIMENNDLPDFVCIEDTAVEDSERYIEVLPCDIEDARKLHAETRSSKVDLSKLAMYHVQGYGTSEVAKIFGVSVRRICEIKASDKFKAMLTVLNLEIISTARTFLTASGLKAVKTLLQCMDSRDDRVKLNAATQVLDRIGLKNPDQIEIISKGDRINEMSQEELMGVIKLGMDEIIKKG